MFYNSDRVDIRLVIAVTVGLIDQNASGQLSALVAAIPALRFDSISGQSSHIESFVRK